MKKNTIVYGGLPLLAISMFFANHASALEMGLEGSMNASVMNDTMNNTMTNTMDSSGMVTVKLSVGSKGESVMDLQSMLMEKGFLSAKYESDGNFGRKTKKALMKYQKSIGAWQTGKYDEQTMKKMKAMMMKKEEGVMVGGALMIATRDIVDNAVLAKNVTTVVAAVKAAGLVDTLKSAGPFTVFAPNNEAFAKLPAGTVEMLLKPENKAKLVDILTYHVVSGKFKAIDLTDGKVLTTVEGKTLKITRDGNKIWINGKAMVETKDVISRNGVTFVIDSVLLPE